MLPILILHHRKGKNKMLKRFLQNASLYLLALANLAYALKHGFTWLSWLALGLASAAAVLDVLCWLKSRKDGPHADA